MDSLSTLPVPGETADNEPLVLPSDDLLQSSSLGARQASNLSSTSSKANAAVDLGSFRNQPSDFNSSNTSQVSNGSAKSNLAPKPPTAETPAVDSLPNALPAPVRPLKSVLKKTNHVPEVLPPPAGSFDELDNETAPLPAESLSSIPAKGSIRPGSQFDHSVSQYSLDYHTPFISQHPGESQMPSGFGEAKQPSKLPEKDETQDAMEEDLPQPKLDSEPSAFSKTSDSMAVDEKAGAGGDTDDEGEPDQSHTASAPPAADQNAVSQLLPSPAHSQDEESDTVEPVERKAEASSPRKRKFAELLSDDSTSGTTEHPQPFVETDQEGEVLAEKPPPAKRTKLNDTEKEMKDKKVTFGNMKANPHVVDEEEAKPKKSAKEKAAPVSPPKSSLKPKSPPKSPPKGENLSKSFKRNKVAQKKEEEVEEPEEERPSKKSSPKKRKAEEEDDEEEATPRKTRSPPRKTKIEEEDCDSEEAAVTKKAKTKKSSPQKETKATKKESPAKKSSKRSPSPPKKVSKASRSSSGRISQLAGSTLQDDSQDDDYEHGFPAVDEDDDELEEDSAEEKPKARRIKRTKKKQTSVPKSYIDLNEEHKESQDSEAKAEDAEGEQSQEEKEKEETPENKPRKTSPKKPAPIVGMLSGMTFVVTGIKDENNYTPEVLKEMIKSNGGKIANAIGPNNVGAPRVLASTTIVPSWVLLSDTYQRTYKYIMALVDGIPCLSYKWLVDSLNTGEFVDPKPYLLPAGVDLKGKLHPIPKWFLKGDQSDVSEFERMPLLMKSDPGGPLTEDSKRDRSPIKRTASGGFQPRVEIVGFKEFCDQWKPIVDRVGGLVIERLGRVTSKKDFHHYRLHYILSDNAPGQWVVDKKELGFSLYSIEWLLQCIIQRKLLDIKQSDKFEVHTD